MRPYQWSKNSLIFLPILSSLSMFNQYLLIDTFFAALSFSLAASSVYILNDILDIDSDKSHPSKKKRPIAAGDLNIKLAYISFAVLLSISLLIAFNLSEAQLCLVLFYVVLANLYSFFFKKLLLIDCLCLAIFYVYRLVVGAYAANISLTFHFFLFFFFLFLSLSFMKRYSEFFNNLSISKIKSNRAYSRLDANYFSLAGLSSAYLSIFVFSQYLYTDLITNLYSLPILIWLIFVLFFYWINYIWLIVLRGNNIEDPIKFIFNDKRSILILFLTIFILFIAI
jgi:4-hydroxybenzoate polyprenyltransferase